MPELPLPTKLACCVQGTPERVNTQAAPVLLLSPYPPNSAMFPSVDNAVALPAAVVAEAPAGTSLLPCCVQAPADSTNPHTAPTPELSPLPPNKAVAPSPDNATVMPSVAVPTAPVPTSFNPCWVQAVPERVNTHAAPTEALSYGPPIKAVSPSDDRLTELPCAALPIAPLPTNLGPCWLQTAPARTNTQDAPAPEASPYPPSSAVLPSADKATDAPTNSSPLRPVGSNLEPCCDQTPAERVKTQAAPIVELSSAPPISAVLPSDDRAAECPKSAAPTASDGTSLAPCCAQPLLERVNTHAAPTPLLSS